MAWPVPTLEVLYEDNHLLVVNKPAGLPTMGLAAGEMTALIAAKEYVRRKYDKPGNVYLGVVSRLDAPVTGVLLLARTSKAASRLAAAFKQRDVDKLYWAVTEKLPATPAARLEHFLRKDERHKKVHVADPAAPDAQQAVLSYRLRATEPPRAWLEVQLETGRKHQIRVQLAASIGPVVGDRKYGSQIPLREGIALHARRLEFEHPIRKTPLVVEAPLPRSWRASGPLRFVAQAAG
jgi:23S rRNA pseudouridine1911/1915/1917 synthase